MRYAAHFPASTAVAVARAALLAVAACVAVTALAQPSPPTATADAPAAAKRPKIGLVLSGGGARGITHIGVLKVMEEMRIPIGYLAATSMGAIVGGFYASGMSPAKMQEVVTSVNWSKRAGASPDNVSKLLGRADFLGNAGIEITRDDFVNVAARAGALSRDDPSLVNPFLLGGFLNLSGLRNGELVGSPFLAADTFLGPFYFAYGRATGGASSFYLFLGRPL